MNLFSLDVTLEVSSACYGSFNDFILSYFELFINHVTVFIDHVNLYFYIFCFISVKKRVYNFSVILVTL